MRTLTTILLTAALAACSVEYDIINAPRCIDGGTEYQLPLLVECNYPYGCNSVRLCFSSSIDEVCTVTWVYIPAGETREVTLHLDVDTNDSHWLSAESWFDDDYYGVTHDYYRDFMSVCDPAWDEGVLYEIF